MQTKNQKKTGYFLLFAAFILFVVVAYENNSQRHIPIIFSPKSMLASLGESYKKEYLEPETFRTLDKQQNNVTTSEGQSYTMLRSVWTDDQQTFDQSWKWTKDNLEHPKDKLVSWLFGKRSNGSYGILTDKGGENSASDADGDIALALIFAFSRWKDPVYLGDARALLNDIWTYEVVTIKGRPYLASNNVEKKTSQKILINPSYFAPYSYKIFAEIDPSHDWRGVASTSYEVIDQSMSLQLDKTSTSNLPPDWVTVDKVTGQIEAAKTPNLTTNYGYDALRVPWRLAMDWQWNKDERAKSILEKMKFLSTEWQNRKALYSTYGHDGSVVNKYESPAMYGGAIGYFMVADPDNAKKVYSLKLQSLFNPDTQTWKQVLSYYDDNWAWFGISLYNGTLPNLYALQ